MKKLLLLFAVSSFVFSCKKESGIDHPKETLLAEITQDSLKYLRFSYDANNKITKMEGFNTDPANNTMTSYINFQYSAEGNLKELTSYTMPGSVAVTKIVIQTDSAGRLAGASIYDLQGISPNTPNTTVTYSYNAKGLVNKVVRKDKSGEFLSQTNLIYYDDGHLKEEQGLKKSGDQLWMNYKESYSIPSGNYASGLERLRVILGGEFMASMYSETISNVTYSQAGVVTNHWNQQMSAREFNEDGMLHRQIVTHKYIKPEKDDKVYVHAYKYIQQ
jgi:hypothetical protein